MKIELPLGERVLVNLRLDVEPLGFRAVQLCHLNFVVEVADVADDGLVLHLAHVVKRDDVQIAGAGDVDIAAAEGFLDRGDLVTFHRGLQSVDGVDLGDDDASAHAAEGVGLSPCRRRRSRR